MRAIRDGVSDVVRYQMRHRQAKQCTHCPNPAAPGRTRCENCLRKMRNRYHQRKGWNQEKAA